MNPKLQIQKISDTVDLPSYGTKYAARFDLHAALDHITSVTCFLNNNHQMELPINPSKRGGFVDIPPFARALIPTGMIFGFDKDYELQIVPRSGLAVKWGAGLANSMAIIDSDYKDETYIAIMNLSCIGLKISHNERIAQAKLSPAPRAEIISVDEVEGLESNRVGGFGSTGN